MSKFPGTMYIQDGKKFLDIKAGELLFSEGDLGEEMFVVVRGSLSVFKKSDGKEYELLRFYPGQFFGEMSLLENEPRSANVKTIENTTLMVLNKKSFEKVLSTNTDLAVKLLKGMSYRLRNSNDVINRLSQQLEEMGGKTAENTPLIMTKHSNEKWHCIFERLQDKEKQPITIEQKEGETETIHITIHPQFSKDYLDMFEMLIENLGIFQPDRVIIDFSENTELAHNLMEPVANKIRWLHNCGCALDITASLDNEEKNNLLKYMREAIKTDNAYFQKTFTCGLCQKEFRELRVKKNHQRASKIDTDFATYTNGPNPLYYIVSVCPFCGYSFTPQFTAPGAATQKKLLKIIKASPVDFSEKRNIEQVIVAIQRAIMCAYLNTEKDIVLAGLYHNLAWIYRYMGSPEETIHLKKALEHYTAAFANDRGLAHEDRVLYLIGELNARLGNANEAVRWFGRVINESKTAHPQIIKMARSRWQDLREDG